MATESGSTDYWGAIMDGISSYYKSEDEKDKNKKSAKDRQAELRTTGDEARKNAFYGQLLGDWKDQKDKYRKSQGLANYRAFAKQNTQPMSAHSALMRNFVSPNRVQDPGNIPNPAALSGDKPNYASYNPDAPPPQQIPPQQQPPQRGALYPPRG